MSFDVFDDVAGTDAAADGVEGVGEIKTYYFWRFL